MIFGDFKNSPFKDIYDTYNGTIKDLLADIESRYQKFPLTVYNEIRAVFDHIARCYHKDFKDNQINIEVEKAKGHIKRIIFDCYKYLYVYQNRSFNKFEKRTKNVDLRSIDDRRFYDNYSKLRKGARINVRNAKRIESRNKNKAFDLYKESYNMALVLEELIEEYHSQIWQARAKHFFSKIGQIIIYIFIAVIAGIILDFIDFFDLISVHP